MELKFTGAGAVAAPDTLQVRVRPLSAGRVGAGHPPPSRAMTDDEVLAAIRHFTEGQRGPRSRPVRRLVLAGLDPTDLARASAWGELARGLGVTHVTLHLPQGAGPLATGADAVVGTLATPDDAGVLAGWPAHRVGVVRLDEAGASLAAERAAEARAAGLDRLVLSWPFPPEGPPAPLASAPALLDAVAKAAGPLGWTIQGLPACLVGPHAARTVRARNRWYVDADHPPARGLLFFPDVVAWWKHEDCRFCARDRDCDGVAAGWWRAGLVPRLVPLDGAG